MRTQTKQSFFYGWVIVAACFMMQAIPFGVAQNIQPQFIGYVIEGEGFSLTQFSFVFSIGTIVSAMTSPFIGQLFDKPKMKVKVLYTIGAGLCGAGFLLFGYSHSLWAFYGVAAIVQVGTSMISSIGIPVMINMWFRSTSGKALGIAFAGGGIGNVVLQQIAAHTLASKGYSWSYIFFGSISLAIGLPIALFFIRRPQENEVEDYEKAQRKADVQTAKQHGIQNQRWGYTLQELKKNKFFWLFGIGFGLVGIYVSGMCVQFMAYFKSLNFDAAMLGNIGSIFALFSIVGNVLGGWLFDKLGLKNCLCFAGVMIVACGLCLIFAPIVPFLAYIFAAGVGLTVFAYILGPSYMTGRLFGNKFYGAILGVIHIFFAIGYALGAVIFAMIVDASGNYGSAWLFMTSIGGICYILLIVAANHFLKQSVQKIN